MYSGVLDRDVLDRDAPDRDVLDRDVLDRDVLDQDALDREALDREALDREVLDTPTHGRARALARPSIRPSAFGIPRQHAPEPAFVTTVVERIERVAQPAARPSTIPAPPSDPPRGSQPVRKRDGQPARPAVKTDIEELLPLSQVVKSLPRPPKLLASEAPLPPLPTTRRFPWMSLSIFAVAFSASLAPLLRYSGERTIEPTSQQLAAPREVDWSALVPPADSRERTPWGEPAASRDLLLEAGERALSAGDASGAERAFEQALSFGGDDASVAFGLARVRLNRGDVRGARAWGESALRRRPEEPSYRAFLEQLATPDRPR